MFNLNSQFFYDTFNKVYTESGDKPYIFKTSYGLSMLGTAVSEVERCVIGAGITPSTFIGIRICEEDTFYLRDADSELMYECARGDLSNYYENNWAKDIFHLIGRLTKSVNINGAKILIGKSCDHWEFSHYSAAVALGFSHIFCKNLQPAELLPLILPEGASFAESAGALMSLSAVENRCMLIENRHLVYFPFPIGEFKIVIAVVSDKPFKNPDFKKVLENIKELKFGTDFLQFSQITKQEIELYREQPDYLYALFARNEMERLALAAACLKQGDLARFGEILTQSAEELLKAVGKPAEKVKKMFEISAALSAGCGIYRNKGIFAIVRNGEVDQFVDMVGHLYEKKAGTKPEFYICSSSESCAVTNFEDKN